MILDYNHCTMKDTQETQNESLSSENAREELQFYWRFTGSMNAVMYILNQQPFGIDWICDNSCLVRTLGLSAAELLQNGDTVIKRLNDYPDFSESVLQAVDRFWENPDITWAGVYRIRNMNDQARWIIYSAQTLEKDAEGRPLKVATVAFPVEDVFNTPNTLREFQLYLSKKIYEMETRSMTYKQKEYLKLAARGLSRKEIAAAMNISIHTVDDHRKALLKKFEVRTTAELLQLAQKFGL